MIVKILSHTLFVIRKQFLAELGAFEVRVFLLKTWCLSNMEILSSARALETHKGNVQKSKKTFQLQINLCSQLVVQNASEKVR